MAFVICSTAAWGQNGTNSPYTRYGFGQLADQSLGGNKAMGGIGIGYRDRSQINVTNPASYTAVDSLTFLFEAGVSLQNANFSDGTTKLNAKNSSFDYLAMQFRLFKGMGMTLGFLPYSNVGYSFSGTTKTSAEDPEDDKTFTRTYSGDGGLHQAFIGVGYSPFANFSVGANVSYLFGNFTHKVALTSSDAYDYPMSRTYYAEISDVKFDFGAQYTIPLDKKQYVTLGATYSLGKDLNAINSYISQQLLSGSTVVSDSVNHINKAFQLPHSFGVGATYNHSDKLVAGADVLLQKFGDVRYFGKDNQLADRLKCSFGVQYHPDPMMMNKNFFKRIRYRAGAYYSKPYVKVNGQEAATEYGVSAGLSIPIFTRYSRLQTSTLSLSGEWVKVDPKIDGVLTENYLRLSIGLTFNECWFRKIKVQ